MMDDGDSGRREAERDDAVGERGTWSNYQPVAAPAPTHTRAQSIALIEGYLGRARAYTPVQVAVEAGERYMCGRFGDCHGEVTTAGPGVIVHPERGNPYPVVPIEGPTHGAGAFRHPELGWVARMDCLIPVAAWA